MNHQRLLTSSAEFVSDHLVFAKKMLVLVPGSSSAPPRLRMERVSSTGFFYSRVLMRFLWLPLPYGRRRALLNFGEHSCPRRTTGAARGSATHPQKPKNVPELWPPFSLPFLEQSPVLPAARVPRQSSLLCAHQILSSLGN